MNEKTIMRIEQALGQLAAEWRGEKAGSMRAVKIVKCYTKILEGLLILGVQGGLDPDCELPDEYMPKEYLDFIDRTDI